VWSHVRAYPCHHPLTRARVVPAEGVPEGGAHSYGVPILCLLAAVRSVMCTVIADRQSCYDRESPAGFSKAPVWRRSTTRATLAAAPTSPSLCSAPTCWMPGLPRQISAQRSAQFLCTGLASECLIVAQPPVLLAAHLHRAAFCADVCICRGGVVAPWQRLPKRGERANRQPGRFSFRAGLRYRNDTQRLLVPAPPGRHATVDRCGRSIRGGLRGGNDGGGADASGAAARGRGLHTE
jgi:hypothetical protein